MFGKDAVLQEQGSEDEDWGPNDRRKRKKESDVTSMLVNMCESSKKDQDAVEILEQSERDSDSVEDKGGRRPMFRIPRGAVEVWSCFFPDLVSYLCVKKKRKFPLLSLKLFAYMYQKLRQVFAENELPSKAVRDNLSKELSLDPEKVTVYQKKINVRVFLRLLEAYKAHS